MKDYLYLIIVISLKNIYKINASISGQIMSDEKKKEIEKKEKFCPLCLNISLRNDKQISYYLFNVFLLSGGKSKSRFFKTLFKGSSLNICLL